MNTSKLSSPFDSRESEIFELGLPSSGLRAPTLELFERAGLPIPSEKRRKLSWTANELGWEVPINVTFLQTGEIPGLVQSGTLDMGISSSDYVEDFLAQISSVCGGLGMRSRIECIARFNYSRCLSKTANDEACSRTVLCVPNDSSVREIRDLEGSVIDSERPWLTQRFLRERGIESEVIPGIQRGTFPTDYLSPYRFDEEKAVIAPRKGSAEGLSRLRARKPKDEGNIAVAVVSETGASLRENSLRVIETIMENTIQLIANCGSTRKELTAVRMEVARKIADRLCSAEEKVPASMERTGTTAVWISFDDVKKLGVRLTQIRPGINVVDVRDIALMLKKEKGIWIMSLPRYYARCTEREAQNMIRQQFEETGIQLRYFPQLIEIDGVCCAVFAAQNISDQTILSTLGIYDCNFVQFSQ